MTPSTPLHRPEPVPGPASLGPVGDPSSSGTGQHGVRNKLIEAAARAFWHGWDLDDEDEADRAECCGKAARAVDAVLPLIADEIEATKSEYTRTLRGSGRNEGVDFTAALLRSWSS